MLASCPGACGDLARAFNAAHESDQPGMALAAAIGTLSAIKSGRVGYRGVNANTYFCILGGSGVGKTQMLKKAKLALRAAEVGGLEMHPPASGVALFDRVAIGERLLAWDEFGEVLKQVVEGKQGYASDILRRVKILFNECENVLGNAYANNSQSTITDIKEGYLSILAASTPEHIQEVLQSDFVRDGLVPRFLIIESEPLKAFREKDLVIPQSFLAQVKKLWQPLYGNLINTKPILEQFSVFPKQELIWSEDAKVLAKMYQLETQLERRREANESKLSVYNRKFEHFIKIVLSIADNNIVEAEHVDFTKRFIELTLSRQVEICLKELGRTKITKLKEELLAAIPSDGWASLSDLHGVTRGIAPAMRRDCLSDLEAIEAIYGSVDNDSPARKKPKRYTKSASLYEQAESSNDKRRGNVSHERYLDTGMLPALDAQDVGLDMDFDDSPLTPAEMARISRT